MYAAESDPESVRCQAYTIQLPSAAFWLLMMLVSGDWWWCSAA